jgi:SRSO17 transposase
VVWARTSPQRVSPGGISRARAKSLQPIARRLAPADYDQLHHFVTVSPWDAATIKARWVCEQAHQQLKEELGLDHFEGRSWRGLHRHTLMTLIAYLFLQHQRLQAAKRGKKEGRGDRPRNRRCPPFGAS